MDNSGKLERIFRDRRNPDFASYYKRAENVIEIPHYFEPKHRREKYGILLQKFRRRCVQNQLRFSREGGR